MKKNKYFIITIDTEADNQWDINQECTTKNSKFLPRFQELAEKYEFKPVWLTTYEMANDNFFVEYFKEKQDKNLCEIGMHLHAWNTPPEYNLNSKNKNRAYLIEYPKNIMEEKIKNIDTILTKKFNKKPITHRSGRWTTNSTYYELLSKYGYKIDCSVTPHISWEKSYGKTGIRGSNYKKCSEQPYFINDTILELPMTIRRSHTFQKERIKNIKRLIREIELFILGRSQWIRPDNNFSLSGIFNVIDKCSKNNDYIMFMIHSSELMPNGSPNFKTKEDIEKLYLNIEQIFKYVKNKNYKGITIREYYKLNNKRKVKNETINE